MAYPALPVMHAICAIAFAEHVITRDDARHHALRARDALDRLMDIGKSASGGDIILGTIPFGLR